MSAKTGPGGRSAVERSDDSSVAYDPSDTVSDNVESGSSCNKEVCGAGVE